MQTKISGASKSPLLAFLLFLAAFGLAVRLNARPPAQDATNPAGGQEKAKAAPAAGDGDYVGSETCITCHQDQDHRFKNTVMGKAMAHPKTPLEARGCEACHGPGKAHVEAGGGRDTIPVRFTKGSKNTAEEKNSMCLACHEKGNRLFWDGSPHETRNVSCVDCHAGHEPQPVKVSTDARYNSPLSDVHGTKKGQPELCLTCHQMRKAQLQRSSHMPY